MGRILRLTVPKAVEIYEGVGRGRRPVDERMWKQAYYRGK